MVSMTKAKSIKRRHTDRLLEQPGVWGVGLECDENEQPVLVLHIDGKKQKELETRLPSDIEGCPVRVVIDAPFHKQ